jgi:putative transposase
MEKVAPSERFRCELDEVLAGMLGEDDLIEVVGWLGARLILQQALEDEVTEFLGRRRYERAGEGSNKASPNRYSPGAAITSA